MTKERLDGQLVVLGLVSTRSQAQQLIKEGVIFVNGKQVTKASTKIGEQDQVEVKKETLWVGRGAEKMAGAFQDFGFSFKDKIVGDMGASTGGFVQFALHQGAKKVYAVDVGRDQLAPELRQDPRVINREGTNIKDGLSLEDLCDLIVVDLSFISLTLVLEPILSCLRSKGELVLLVKPQFEVGRESIGKKGLVKDEKAIFDSLERIFDFLLERGCPVLKVAPCKIKGKTGNQEYFFYCVYDELLKGYSRDSLRTDEALRDV